MLARPGRVAGRESAGDGERLLALRGESSTLRDESARPSSSRTVSTTRISTSRLRSRTSCFTTATCCASFRPNQAICGRTMFSSFRQTVATPRKCCGRYSDSSPSAAPAGSTQVANPGGYISLDARGEQDVDPLGFGAAPGRPPDRAGTAARSALSENCAGLTNAEATSTSHSGRAARKSAGVPGVQRAHRRDEADDAVPRQVELGDRADDLHARVASTSAS